MGNAVLEHLEKSNSQNFPRSHSLTVFRILQNTLALVGHPSSDGVMIKMPTSTGFTTHFFLLAQLKLNLPLLDQLRLA